MDFPGKCSCAAMLANIRTAPILCNAYGAINIHAYCICFTFNYRQWVCAWFNVTSHIAVSSNIKWLKRLHLHCFTRRDRSGCDAFASLQQTKLNLKFFSSSPIAPSAFFLLSMCPPPPSYIFPAHFVSMQRELRRKLRRLTCTTKASPNPCNSMNIS